jgi:hypothetical protein
MIIDLCEELAPYYEFYQIQPSYLTYYWSVKYVAFNRNEEINDFANTLIDYYYKSSTNRNQILRPILKAMRDIVNNHVNNYDTKDLELGQVIEVITNIESSKFIFDGKRLVSTKMFPKKFRVLENDVPFNRYLDVTTDINIDMSNYKSELLDNLVVPETCFMVNNEKYVVVFNSFDKELIEHEIKSKNLPELSYLSERKMFWRIIEGDDSREA